MNNIIECRSLYFRYEKTDKYIFANLNFSMKKGEYIFLYSPSGYGKSTFFDLLAMNIDYTRGDYYFRGESVRLLNEKEKTKRKNKFISYIYQNHRLLHHFNVYENISIVSRLYYGHSNEEYIDYLLDFFDIYSCKNKNISEISQGQKQKVSIARALIKNPDVIFADECTASLDHMSSHSIIDFLLDYCFKKKITLLIATHDESFKKYKFSYQIINRSVHKIS